MTSPGPLCLAICCASFATAFAGTPGAMVDRYVLFGFGPFAGRQENGSWQSVKQFAASGEQARSVEVPVVWGAPRKKILEALSGPDKVVLVGLGEGGSAYEVETVAFNERGEIRDETGNQPAEKKILPGGDARLESYSRAEDLAGKLQAAGFPARISKDAGRFLCNEMLYELARIQRDDPRVAAAYFIHVPVLGSRVSRGTEQVQVDHEYCAAFGKALMAALRELHPLAEVKAETAR